MIAFIFAIIFTLGTSAFCSLLEAFILSINTVDIEVLRKQSPQRSQLLARLKEEIEETSSAILTLNTIANTLGASLVGYMAGMLFSDFMVGLVTMALVLGILLFSEIIPKNIGAIYKTALAPHLVLPLRGVCLAMWPFARLAKLSVTLFIRHKPMQTPEQQEAEILYLADKQARDGSLSTDERNMIFNALKLDDLPVGELMTPRTVVTFLAAEWTIAKVFCQYPDIPFSRMPVYRESIDTIVGMVRRRDLLVARSQNLDAKTIGEMMSDIPFFPENMNAADGLQHFLKTHRQLAVIVDEFGSTAGVIALEDIIEYIIGQEIFEEDDIAVDMRHFAKKQAMIKKKQAAQVDPDR